MQSMFNELVKLKARFSEPVLLITKPIVTQQQQKYVAQVLEAPGIWQPSSYFQVRRVIDTDVWTTAINEWSNDDPNSISWLLLPRQDTHMSLTSVCKLKSVIPQEVLLSYAEETIKTDAWERIYFLTIYQNYTSFCPWTSIIAGFATVLRYLCSLFFVQ